MKDPRDNMHMNMMQSSMYSTNAETASVYSDVELSSECVDENGEPLLRGVSSSKAVNLANEIAGMEQLCARLEERNKWLTARLFQNRRKFIESTMLKTSSALKIAVMA